MRSIFKSSPARAADVLTEPSAKSVETADRAEVQVQPEPNPFRLNPSYTRRMQRKMVEVVSCAAIAGIGGTMTFAMTLTDAHWSVCAIAGAATGYLLGRSVNAAREMLGYQGLDRVISQTYRAEAREQRVEVRRQGLEIFGLTCELNAARHEANLLYTAHLFSVAADMSAAPAEGDSGAMAPSADVIFMNPVKPKAVH